MGKTPRLEPALLGPSHWGPRKAGEMRGPGVWGQVWGQGITREGTPRGQREETTSPKGSQLPPPPPPAPGGREWDGLHPPLGSLLRGGLRSACRALWPEPTPGLGWIFP